MRYWETSTSSIKGDKEIVAGRIDWFPHVNGTRKCMYIINNWWVPNYFGCAGVPI